MSRHPIIFPTDDATGAEYCPVCGEPECDPSVEAFELTGDVMCDLCAEQVIEDHGQFGVGA